MGVSVHGWILTCIATPFQKLMKKQKKNQWNEVAERVKRRLRFYVEEHIWNMNKEHISYPIKPHTNAW